MHTIVSAIITYQPKYGNYLQCKYMHSSFSKWSHLVRPQLSDVSHIIGGAYVTNLGSRKNCVLIFGHCYRCVLTIDRKWKIDVAIFFC